MQKFLRPISIVVLYLSLSLFCACNRPPPETTVEALLLINSNVALFPLLVDGETRDAVFPDTLKTLAAGPHVFRLALTEGYASDPESLVVTFPLEQGQSVSFTVRMLIQRRVFIEDFSNTACAGCASMEGIMEEVNESYGLDTLICLTYHTRFPDSHDPMNRSLSLTDLERLDYYGIVNAMPLLIANGDSMGDPVNGISPSGVDIHLAVDTLKWKVPIYDVTVVTDTITGDSLAVEATVSPGYGAVPGDAHLWVCLQEDHLFYNPADTTILSPNGIPHWDRTFRAFASDVEGYHIPPLAGSPWHIRFAVARDSRWKVENMHWVAFIQRTSQNDLNHHDVLQAYATRVMNP